MHAVYMTELPKCDTCRVFYGRSRRATYDSPCRSTSQWAYMCADCLDVEGIRTMATRLESLPAAVTALCASKGWSTTSPLKRAKAEAIIMGDDTPVPLVSTTFR